MGPTPTLGDTVDTRKAFSLVELMIVVAIIGILAAIAIPNMVQMQLRAKRSEIPANVDGIKMSELGYDASADIWVQEPVLQPDTNPGKGQRPWLSGSNFDTLGWAPDGHVRGSYKVVSISGPDFRVTGESDVDGNDDNAVYTATMSINPAMVSNNDTY